MDAVELKEGTIQPTQFTDAELMAIIDASPIIKKKVEDANRFVSKLMEKYPDLEDRLSGKVPHP